MSALEVLATGPLALVEDLGRPGLAAIGVGRSGAADRSSLRLANRLVGNPEGAPALEVTLGGLEVRACDGDLWVAVTGAHCPVTVDRTAQGPNCSIRVADGQVLRLGMPAAGLRSYVGIRGGIAVEPVLGSCSTDVMSGVGPAPLEPGTVLPVGCADEPLPETDQAPVRPPEDSVVTLRVVRGPRDSWVADVEELTTTEWTASDRTDRVGMRLDGGALEYRETDGAQLPSEGALRGAIQVPPNGQPVVFLADHPVTGGYPVVAVVVDADVDKAAQVRPGQRIDFRWSSGGAQR